MLQESSYEEKLNGYTYDDWKPLLGLIPQIETISKFGKWYGGESKDGVLRMPYCMPIPVVEQFLEAVYNIPIMIEFNWPKWDEGRKIARNDFDFDTVDVVIKCKLITAIVRNDRFCEGALVSAFESGLILKILKSILNQVAK